MNILQYLVESTYNIGHAVDQIYKEIIEPIVIRMKKGEIVNIRDVDIKPYLNYILDKYMKDWDIEILLSFRQSPKLQAQVFWVDVNPEASKKMLAITINISKKDIKTLPIKQIKTHISESLTHELIHVIDRVRSSFKIKTSYNDKNLYRYVSEPLEFNAFINEIKKFAIRNKKTWNKIQSYEELKNVIDNAAPAIAQVEKQNPDGFKILMKKLLTRMARENMLPVDMINKYDAY